MVSSSYLSCLSKGQVPFQNLDLVVEADIPRIQFESLWWIPFLILRNVFLLLQSNSSIYLFKILHISVISWQRLY